MARKKKQSTTGTKRKSGSRNSKSNGFTDFILSWKFFIFVLIVLAIGLIWWFLPDILDWYSAFSQSLFNLLGIGIALIGLFILILLIIVFSKKSYLFTKFWRQWIGSIALLFFIWGVVALLSPAYGGTFGSNLIGNTILSRAIVLLLLFLFVCLCFSPRLFYIGITKFFKFIWWMLTGIALGIYKGIKLLITGRKSTEKPEKRIITHTKQAVAEPQQEKEEKPEKELKDIRELETYKPQMTPGGWQLPPISLLDKIDEPEVTESDVEKRAELITEALASYGVDAKVVQINVGPTVTQFGVEPGWDIKYKEIRERDKDGNIKTRQQEVSRTRVKVEKISALSNDLALALAASGIRIEAPVPGKSIVGIEVPNTTFGSVNLRSIIESTNYQRSLLKSKLAIPLGKGAGGEVLAADLAKMPHLLIAGSTGSGKTVFINSLICCLLFCNTPDDLRFIMIDPKRVELVNYNGLPQLIAPVVVESERAVVALHWLVAEMDRRYKVFAEAGARNIETYNKGRAPGEAMPFIVLVIDELADLMMTAFAEVEQNLCRLAQLSRATGIHLIVATQRPSVDVITGLIKANFPTRLSFSLTSQIDSRTILDTPGAEKLLGRGDMLFMPTDASKPKRLQGPFLSDNEIERLVKFWTEQSRADMGMIKFDEMELKEASTADDDSLMEEARQLATEHTGISTSFLQRRLKIGYPRAARIMEKLKEEGF